MIKQIRTTIGIYFILGLSIVLGQTNTENYIQTTRYQVKTQNGVTTIMGDDLVADDKTETINYFDGLGRIKQSILKQAGGNREDLITPIIYDAQGRQAKTLLPYARIDNSLDIEINALNQQELFYEDKFPSEWDTGSSVNAYSQSRFEASPLNRVLEQGAPGNDWRVLNDADTDHTVKFEYALNDFEEVMHFKVTHINHNKEQTNLVFNGYYAANTLTKTITKDENWQPNIDSNVPHLDHTIHEFKDQQGRVVLKRAFNNNLPHDTYYVYDNFGNLSYVIPPKGAPIIVLEVPSNQSGLVNATSYPWHNLIETDKTFAEAHQKRLKGYKDDLLKKTDIETTYNGSGSFALKSYKDGTYSVDINITATTPFALKNGVIASFGDKLRIKDVLLGELTGEGYSYKLSIKNNAFVIEGEGTLNTIDEEFFSIPPQTNDYVIDPQVIDGLCYIYHYDYRNRLTEKKIPGKGWEYIVYDALDRPVLTQDANMRNNQQWLFTKYDHFDRVLYTGLYHYIATGNQENAGRLDLQQTVNNQSTINELQQNSNSNLGIVYSNNVYPNTQGQMQVLTVNYYDNYTGINAPNIMLAPNTTIYDTPITNNTKGLATGSKIRVLGTNDWIYTTTYYDEDARPIYIASNNTYLQTIDLIKTDLDFTGKVIETQTEHTKNSVTTTIIDRYTYDHTGRLLTQTQQINTGLPQLISNATYDNLGQLKAKAVGGTVATIPEQSVGLQDIIYTYNIRGWLEAINNPDNLGDDLFGFKINYNTTSLPMSTPLYNGNISETHWTTANDNLQRHYKYSYDALNRITNATYSNSGSQVGGLVAQEDYSLSGVSYDRNGNILSLERTGRYYQTPQYTGQEHYDLIDLLTYNYANNSNTLLNVGDTASNFFGFKDGNHSSDNDDYSYDSNGNMTQDLNKGLQEITYNHLNLPTLITTNAGNITYIYDASGVKLEKVVTEGSSETATRYAGNFIYKKDTDGERLEFFSHPEGYVQSEIVGNVMTFDYIYQYKDHLGNIRLSYKSQNNGLEIVEENHYYPFGLQHKGYNNNVSINSNGVASKFKYNGIEFEEALNLDLYEMDFRQYDPAIGRFNSIDPITHYEYSTYNAFDNNPIFWADPSGADSVMEAKKNKPEWDNTISSNAGGDNGGGTKPKVYKGPGVVGEDSGMVNQLPTICLGCNDGSDYWSSEGGMYGYTGDFESYKKEFGYSGSFDDVNSQWNKEHGGDYANQVVAWESRRKAASAMAHLNVWYTFFYQAEEVFYVMPGSAFGSLARGSARAFGFKGILSRRQILYNRLNFNNPRGPEYFTQDGGHKIWPKTAYRQTIMNGKKTWLPNKTWGFEYRGSFRRYELGIRNDGTIIHNNSFKLERWEPGLSNWYK